MDGCIRQEERLSFRSLSVHVAAAAPEFVPPICCVVGVGGTTQLDVEEITGRKDKMQG